MPTPDNNISYNMTVLQICGQRPKHVLKYFKSVFPLSISLGKLTPGQHDLATLLQQLWPNSSPPNEFFDYSGLLYFNFLVLFNIHISPPATIHFTLIREFSSYLA